MPLALQVLPAGQHFALFGHCCAEGQQPPLPPQSCAVAQHMPLQTLPLSQQVLLTQDAMILMQQFAPQVFPLPQHMPPAQKSAPIDTQQAPEQH